LLVQAFLPDAPVEGLDVGIIGGRARPTEGELDATPVRPGVKGLGGELGPIVDLQDLREPTLGGKTLQDGDDTRSGERAIDLNGGTLTTPGID
jgi:hypothetical protein